MNLSQLLEDCHAIAEDAGRAILQVYKTDFEVEKKADNSPLTQADLAANRIIMDALQQLDPQLPRLSEEGTHTDYAERSQWARYWLIDPLDGTREFVGRSDEFTVNIALIENGVPILGVVLAPVLEVTYLAARGVGACKVQAGKRQAIHTRATPARPCLVLSKSHRGAELDALLATAPPHDATSRGSSLKLCLVAEGAADLYPRTGPTSEWDTAAGHCVVEQAGGVVLTLPDWAPLRYNHKASLLNPGFVVIGDPGYGWRERLQAAA